MFVQGLPYASRTISRTINNGTQVADQLKGGATLFADLAGSTSLYESVGDVAASQMVRAALDRMSDLVKKNDGVVIKTLGDAVHAWFPTADSAAIAAISIQQMRNHDNLRVRVGFHYGNAVHDHSDIFGDSVNVAARLASTARAGEILTSRETISRLSKPISGQVRDLGAEHLKGKTQSMHVFQMLWEEDDLAVTRAYPTDAGGDHLQVLADMCVLRLTFGRRTSALTKLYVPFTLGRDKSASMRVDSHRVSRNHAHLEFHHSKFVLVDHSTNGTFVTPEGGGEVRLQRESMPLLGRGVFSLGVTGLQNPHSIQYAFER